MALTFMVPLLWYEHPGLKNLLNFLSKFSFTDILGWEQYMEARFPLVGLGIILLFFMRKK